MVAERVWSATHISATSARFSTCARHSVASQSNPGTKTSFILSINSMITRAILLAACFLSLPAAADGPQRANFNSERFSPEAKHVADWVVHSGDNHAEGARKKLPFVILDK